MLSRGRAIKLRQNATKSVRERQVERSASRAPATTLGEHQGSRRTRGESLARCHENCARLHRMPDSAYCELFELETVQDAPGGCA
jgi:hypothetical protein